MAGQAEEQRAKSLSRATPSFPTLFAIALAAGAVPYARVDQCGDWRQHDLAAAQAVAREVLARRAAWREIA